MSTENTKSPPSEMCESVYEFMDGELPEPQADHFRHHLARCEFCAQRLGDAWLLDERRKGIRSKPVLVSWWQAKWVPAFSGLAAVAAAVLVVLRPGGLEDHQPKVRYAQARTNGSGTLAYAPMFQPPEQGVLLGGPQQPESKTPELSPEEMAEIGKRLVAFKAKGDFLGLANTHLAAGQTKKAKDLLDQIPDSPDRDVLISAIALESSGPEEAEKALEAADRALRQKPGLPAALWNRALALGRLELPAAAKHAFDVFARTGEKGWSTEAAADAKAWDARLGERRQRYLAADRACREMLESGTPMSPEMAAQVPGLARACLYKAARAALSGEQARLLLPLARQLDALDDGEWLRRYVESVAARSFARRRPLAEQYRRLALREDMPRDEVERLLETLRGSDEKDISLGALADVPLELERAVTPRYQEALEGAAASGDPWWVKLAVEHKGMMERQGERLEQALRILEPALKGCEPRQSPRAMDIRCAEVRRQMARAYGVMNRIGEAREQGRLALGLAGLQNDWDLEMRILVEMATSDRQGHEAMSLAFFDEAVQREPAGCRAPALTFNRPVDWDYVYSNLAQTHIRVLDFDAARRALEEARYCKNMRTLQRLQDLADLARIFPPSADDAREFEALMDRMSSNVSPTMKVLALEIRGRYLLEVDPLKGSNLLRQAIREAEKAPDMEVVRRAAVYAYTALILAAGKSQRFDEAFELFAEERSIPAPRGCVLAVAADDERTLVLVRGSSGTTRGRYDAGRTVPLKDARGLIPDDLGAELRGCPTVSVMARPPLVGMDGLLADEVAWSYLGPRAAVEPAGGAGESLLLVTRPLPPPELRLDDIGILKTPSAGPGAQVEVLKEGDATPDKVLEAMAKASVIYLHAHGILRDSADPAYLALSGSPETGYQLRAADIRTRKLARAPIVVLISCDAAHTGPHVHQVFDLPSAFLQAGARMVFAARAQIPNDQAAQFFEDVMKKMREGADPAVALRETKKEWAERAKDGWVQHVLLFQASGN